MHTDDHLKRAYFNPGNTGIQIVYHPKTRNAPILIFCPGPGIRIAWKSMQKIAGLLAENNLFVVLMQPSFENDEPLQSTMTTYLNDYLIVLEWLLSEDFELKEIADTGDITLSGMDRGATAGILFCLEDPRVRQVIALSPLIDILSCIQGRENDQLHIISATGVEMKSTTLLEEDYHHHLVRLNLQSNLAKLDKPLFLFYGEKDDPGLIDDIHTAYDFVGHAVMMNVSGAGHALGLEKDTDQFPAIWEILAEELAEICR